MKTLDFAERWGQSRLSSLFIENTTKNTPFAEENALQFFFGSIIPKKKYELTEGLIETYEKYIVVFPNDIMINGLNLNYDFVSQRIALVKEKGIITSAYIALRLRNQIKVNVRYYCYLFKAMDAQKVFHGMGTGIRLTLSFKELKSVMLPVPPHPEQDQIVRFLDWKVSTVNKLIALKRKQITLLEEHKASVLNTAVTRGIQLNHSLKYSGLKWLPKVPEHWEIVPAKALFSNKRELRHDNDKMMAATQKYGIISQKKYMELEGRRIVLANDNLDKWLHVEPDDFIISLRSFQGGIERCIEAGCVTWHYVVLRPNREVAPTFYRWFFKSPAYISALQHTSDFIRDGQDLRYSNFVKVRLLKIPLTEQIEIAEYLDKAMPRYDAAIIKREEEIQTLCEFRSRLISDVVTGKIDVRGIQIPEYEFAEETVDRENDENMEGMESETYEE